MGAAPSLQRCHLHINPEEAYDVMIDSSMMSIDRLQEYVRVLFWSQKVCSSCIFNLMAC